jgi:hypothetical protein
MPTDYIRYDLLAQAALRGVLRTVLTDAAKKGLPGEHHFKITFSTTAPGVRLSERMRAQYPEAMTIILQHQFWDLVVDSEAFEVGLSFGGLPERITVPFEAVTAFFDPAVQFGLQFEPMRDDAAGEAPAPGTDGDRAKAASPHTPVAAKFDAAAALPAKTNEPVAPSPDSGNSGGGEVVRLDRFRKK